MKRKRKVRQHLPRVPAEKTLIKTAVIDSKKKSDHLGH